MCVCVVFWYGVVKFGMVWHGVVRFGIGVVWCCRVPCDVVYVHVHVCACAKVGGK